MKQLALLRIVLLPTSTTPFALLPTTWRRPASLELASTSDHICKLQQEIEAFQDDILHDFELANPQSHHPEDIAEIMLEKATHIAALERHQQQEVLRAAFSSLKMAQRACEYAQSLMTTSPQQWITTQEAWEADLLEPIDHQLADLECFQDDQHNMVPDSQKHEQKQALAMAESAKRLERDAQERIDKVQEQLEQLEHHENELKSMLQELRSLEKEVHEVTDHVEKRERHDRVKKTVDKAKYSLSEIERARQILREEEGKFFHSQWDDRRIH